MQIFNGPQFTARHFKWIAFIFLQFLLIGCAMSGQKFANQSFDFSYKSTEIDILDWQYGEHGYVGNEHQALPRAPKYIVDQGLPVGGGGGMSGGMPVGDFLYVKWRIKATGEIHEDKVDLRGKLPKDMNNHGIHFIVKGAQLYVFLVPPRPPYTPPFNDSYEGMASWPAGKYAYATIKNDLASKEYINKLQIYPKTPIFILGDGAAK